MRVDNLIVGCVVLSIATNSPCSARSRFWHHRAQPVDRLNGDDDVGVELQDITGVQQLQPDGSRQQPYHAFEEAAATDTRGADRSLDLLEYGRRGCPCYCRLGFEPDTRCPACMRALSGVTMSTEACELIGAVYVLALFGVAAYVLSTFAENAVGGGSKPLRVLVDVVFVVGAGLFAVRHTFRRNCSCVHVEEAGHGNGHMPDVGFGGP